MEDALTNIQMSIFHLDIYKQEEGHFVGVGYKSFRKSICKGPKQMLVWGNWQCQAGVIQGQQGFGALIQDLGGFSNFEVSFSRPGYFRTINKSVLVDWGVRLQSRPLPSHHLRWFESFDMCCYLDWRGCPFPLEKSLIDKMKDLLRVTKWLSLMCQGKQTFQLILQPRTVFLCLYSVFQTCFEILPYVYLFVVDFYLCSSGFLSHLRHWTWPCFVTQLEWNKYIERKHQIFCSSISCIFLLKTRISNHICASHIGIRFHKCCPPIFTDIFSSTHYNNPFKGHGPKSLETPRASWSSIFLFQL